MKRKKESEKNLTGYCLASITGAVWDPPNDTLNLFFRSRPRKSSNSSIEHCLFTELHVGAHSSGTMSRDSPWCPILNYVLHTGDSAPWISHHRFFSATLHLLDAFWSHICLQKMKENLVTKQNSVLVKKRVWKIKHSKCPAVITQVNIKS